MIVSVVISNVYWSVYLLQSILTITRVVIHLL